MGILNKVADFFKLDDENWLKHSNPWSVYTRYSVLPIIILSIWSREWIYIEMKEGNEEYKSWDY